MPRTPKLPAPPLPSALREPPPRPGEEGRPKDPLESVTQGAITIVDWVDERTSLSGAARWMMFRKVPKGTNWFYTLGSATMFAFLNQAVTGVFRYPGWDPTQPVVHAYPYGDPDFLPGDQPLPGQY